MKETRFTCTLILSILLASSVRAQHLGTQGSLEILTWNVEWFGNNDKGPEDDEKQWMNTKAVLDSLGSLDVIVLEEICNRAMFEQLADSTGYSSYLSPGSDAYQKIGLLYSPQLEVMDGPRIILEDERHQFAQRPPVYAKFNHPVFGEFCVIGIHLKAHIPRSSESSKQDSYNRRKRASELIKAFVKDSLDDEKVVMLGDWNDDVDVSNYNGKPTPFSSLLSDSDFRYITKYLSYTFNESSKYGSIIDHICISNELFPNYRGSGIVATKEFVQDYVSTTSDHYPVFSVFE